MTIDEMSAILADAKRIRRTSGISQYTVAAALGVSQPQISDWDRGYHVPSGFTARRYARFIAGLMRHAEIPEESLTSLTAVSDSAIL